MKPVVRSNSGSEEYFLGSPLSAYQVKVSSYTVFWHNDILINYVSVTNLYCSTLTDIPELRVFH